MFNRNVFNNAKWIIGCKIIQSLIQLIVGMLTARYLGPSNYGLINYAAAVVAFAVPVMQLGLQSTLVQEYVERPKEEGQTLGTSLVMNLLSAAACVVGVAAFSVIANRGEREAILVCILYSVSLVFQSIEMLQYWFQAKLLSKYSSLAMLCSYVVVSTYKIYLLVTGKSVYWFALTHAVEYFATGGLLLLAYRQKGTQKLCFSWSAAKRMFSKSRHYIAAMLMVVVYSSTGSVMLKLMITEAENGFYAAAVTCSCMTSFVFMAIIDTARPVVLESRRKSHLAFEKNMSRVYAIVTYLGLAQSVFFTFFAGIIIKILYSESYLPAVPVLQILVWNTAFSHMGYVRNIWILAEEKHHVLFAINFSGAVANLLLNLTMIPLWGARGAALATVLTQVFTNFIMGFVLRSIRPNNRLLLNGLNPRLLLEFMAEIKGKSCEKKA